MTPRDADSASEPPGKRFLELAPFPQDHPCAEHLHATLAQAYPSPNSAQRLWAKTGASPGDVSWTQPINEVWWQVLEKAARAGRLVRLVTQALRDDTIAGFHETLRGFLLQPAEGEPLPRAGEALALLERLQPGRAARIGLAKQANLDAQLARRSHAALLASLDDPRQLVNLLAAALADAEDEEGGGAPPDPQLVELHASLRKELARDTAPVAAYLDAIEDQHRRLIRTVARLRDEQAALQLEEVFVQVQVARRRAGFAAERCLEIPRAARAAGDDGRLELSAVLADRDLGRCWTLVGNPGSGKTTLLRRLALRHVEEARAALARDEAPSTLPVFVDLAPWARSGLPALEWLERELRPGGAPEGTAALLLEALREGRAVLLLDGLDEIEPARVAQTAERIARLSGEGGKWGEVPVVVSSRPQGFVPIGPEFGQLELLPLTPSAQRRLAERWLVPPLAETFLKRVRGDLALQELAEVPLLLTLMCLVERERPGERALRGAVYAKVLDLLLAARPLDAGFGGGRRLRSRHLVELALERLALELLQRGGGPTWDVDELTDVLLTDSELGSKLAVNWSGIDGFLLNVEEVSGILFAVDGARTRYRFLHRSLQEFLAAKALERVGSGWAELAGKIEREEGRWAEVFSLLASLLEPGEARDLLAELAEKSPVVGLRALATCDGLDDEDVVEVLKIGRPPEDYTWLSNEVSQRAEYFASLADRLGDPVRTVRLLERMLPGAPVTDLGLIWLALEGIENEAAREAQERERFFARAGRPVEELELAWVPVEPGTFFMGSPEGVGHDDEKPRHEVRLTRGFRLLTTPVTNATYERFDRAHSGRRPHVSGVEGDPHPAVVVSWYEAVAFAAWLGGRLPTEAEWEYACRAGSQSRWCFGDDEERLGEYAWYDANSQRTTHPVGQKLPNAWGLYDMHGNVWEWCRDGKRRYAAETLNKDPEGPKDSGGRVFRGGSSWDGAVRTRSACRFHGDPTCRGGDIGFRVVLPAAPPTGLRP